MKAKGFIICVAICAATVLASGYWVLRVEKGATADQLKRNAAWEQERADLEQELAFARNGQSAPAIDVSTITSGMDPVVLVQRLNELEKLTEKRKQLRETLFCFQGLVDAKEESIQPIKTYFLSGNNVTFGNGGVDGRPMWMRGRGQGRGQGRGMGGLFGGGQNEAQALIPNSTRSGLMDVLNEIGGDAAIGLLSQLIPTAIDATELSHLSSILQAIDPSAFREATIKTARNMLAGDVNETEKNQLMDLLATLQDTEYATMLADSLIKENGELNGDNIAMLIRTLGEGAVPSIYNAYNDPNIDGIARGLLMVSTLDYIGQNAQATEMFNTSFAEAKDNRGAQNMMLMALSGIGPEADNITPEMANNRLNVLNSIEQQYGNSDMTAAVRQMLEYRSNPSAYDAAPQIDFGRAMGFGGPGGGGGRGPGGGMRGALRGIANSFGF